MPNSAKQVLASARCLRAKQKQTTGNGCLLEVLLLAFHSNCWQRYALPMLRHGARIPAQSVCVCRRPYGCAVVLLMVAR